MSEKEYASWKEHGITANTPDSILFGAGTIHNGLTHSAYTYGVTADTDIVAGKDYYTQSGTSPDYVYTKVASPVKSAIATYYEITGGGWNFASTIIGATNGGSKLSIKPNIQDIEVDGAFVKAKGLTLKVGETATMEINFAEIKPELLKKSLFAKEGTSDATGYDMLESKPDIESGDYFENFAFVGRTVTKKPIIVIFENALCTSGFEVDAKHKEQGTPAVTIECYGDVEEDDGLKVLPYHIYYPEEED